MYYWNPRVLCHLPDGILTLRTVSIILFSFYPIVLNLERTYWLQWTFLQIRITIALWSAVYTRLLYKLSPLSETEWSQFTLPLDPGSFSPILYMNTMCSCNIVAEFPRTQVSCTQYIMTPLEIIISINGSSKDSNFLSFPDSPWVKMIPVLGQVSLGTF